MADSSRSLREVYASATTLRTKLDEYTDRNTDAYRSDLNGAIAALRECQDLISRLSLFSPNETLEDITSNEIQYLLVDYQLADLLQRSYSEEREAQLRQTQIAYEKFLETLNDYEVLSTGDKKLYERYLENRGAFAVVASTDPTTKRNEKVNRFKQEKELKQKLEYIRQNPRTLESDETTVRNLYLAEISLAVHQTFQALELIPQELSMLSQLRAAPARPPQAIEDERRRAANRDGYDDRLDLPIHQLLGGGRGGPLLSKTGKPLQPFVLMDKRTQLRDGVFKSGHNLPTMSIDEYLEEEHKRGGIIEGGGEASGRAPTPDEDNYEKADAETMKAREWDEFTEANPKGSGNTLNRG